jgi:hypothetical protein
MATLKERKSYTTRGVELRDFRQDKSDGYDETPHRKTKTKKSNKHVGCPGNNDGPHVYVWTREAYWRPVWYWNSWFWSLSDYEYRICAGCYKHKTHRRRKGVR